MRFADHAICQSCGASYRPIQGEELCGKCEAAEIKRLEEIEHELDDEK